MSKRWHEDDEWPYYSPSRPRPAEGGIKAQSKGAFGSTWWARRWVRVLESFNIRARLARGRRYARQGQVLSIAIESGSVRASVQGSRPKPYDVTVRVRTIDDAGWSKLIDALGRQAWYVAKLLAGELPQDIEPLFEEVGLSLFPAKRGDLATECSCPDASNPCKHIAAVYYLLGEEFDRDPFLIFTLRGLPRDALMARLGSAGAGVRENAETHARKPVEPLSAQLGLYWHGAGGLPDDPFGIVEVPRDAAVLPRRLGGFPFWRGESPLLSTLASVYAAASPKGLDVFLAPEAQGRTAASGDVP